MAGKRDAFLSDEDLDLRSLTMRELIAYWNLWLRQAQATNDLDQHSYSHGVFTSEPDSRGATPSSTKNEPRNDKRAASGSRRRAVRRRSSRQRR